MTQTALPHTTADFKADLSIDKMPAHWLMARLGKRVLRPGGLETTRWLLERLAVTGTDDVVELAPGLGLTARALVVAGPRTYLGVERDTEAAAAARRAIASTGHVSASVVLGDAASLPLMDDAASVVVGEAMLSMQTLSKKAAMMREAARVLRPGGRYGIHELAIGVDDMPSREIERVQQDLSKAIRVGVRIGTVGEWRGWLGEAGFDAAHVKTAPMRLLEPDRLIEDEGAAGAARFLFNALRSPRSLRRLREVRAAFRRHRDVLCAVAIVGKRSVG